MIFTKVTVSGEKLLLISASSLPGNLFTDEALMVAYSLDRINEIKTTSMLDTGVTGIVFIDTAMAHHVCDILQISFIQLAKLKPIRRFDSKLTPSITYAIYLTLTVQSHIKLLASFLITKLSWHILILGKPWMQKHRVILNMSCDKVTF